MGIRARDIPTISSAVVLSLFLLLFALGFITDPWRHHLSLSRDFHIGVWNNGLDSRLVFFSDSEYGPYRGSIVGLAGSKYPHTNAFGDFFGVYYRHFTWPDSILWTLMVSMWYPILVFSLWPVWRLITRTRRYAA
jgi:hypothetical protein